MIVSMFILLIAFCIWCGIAATGNYSSGGIKDYNRFFCTHGGMSKRQIRKNIRKGMW